MPEGEQSAGDFIAVSIAERRTVIEGLVKHAISLCKGQPGPEWGLFYDAFCEALAESRRLCLVEHIAALMCAEQFAAGRAAAFAEMAAGTQGRHLKAVASG